MSETLLIELTIFYGYQRWGEYEWLFWSLNIDYFYDYYSEKQKS